MTEEQKEMIAVEMADKIARRSKANWSFLSANDASYEVEQAKRIAWFDKIAPKGNWKTEIDCWIKAVDFDECNSAAIWFTGGPLTVIGTSFSMIHVKGAGYYASVGS